MSRLFAVITYFLLFLRLILQFFAISNQMSWFLTVSALFVSFLFIIRHLVTFIFKVSRLSTVITLLFIKTFLDLICFVFEFLKFFLLIIIARMFFLTFGVLTFWMELAILAFINKICKFFKHFNFFSWRWVGEFATSSALFAIWEPWAEFAKHSWLF